MQFGLDEILTIIDKVNHTGLSAFEYQDADTKIKIKAASKNGTPASIENPTDMAEPESKTEPAAASLAQTDTLLEPEASEKTEDEGPYTVIQSPMVGTFYAAPSEDAEPFVKAGDTIKPGQVVGIVEAMKLMNEIESECEGVVIEVLVHNEQMVEYGQPLIKIKTGE